MSRVAKKAVVLPAGVDCVVSGQSVAIRGPRGSLSLSKPDSVSVSVENGQARVSQSADTPMAGTVRAILANMIKGVTSGFERKLELVGVGYRANMSGGELNLSLGFSHPVVFKTPEGITIETPTQTEILVKGADKQRVGEVAAKIRAFRPPEPYKGKGVRYSGEKIIMKEAKKA